MLRYWVYDINGNYLEVVGVNASYSISAEIEGPQQLEMWENITRYRRHLVIR